MLTVVPRLAAAGKMDDRISVGNEHQARVATFEVFCGEKKIQQEKDGGSNGAGVFLFFFLFLGISRELICYFSYLWKIMEQTLIINICHPIISVSISVSWKKPLALKRA